MKQSKLYRLQRQGNLLILRAAVGATDGTAIVLRLLLDTGASYTMPMSVSLERSGRGTCSFMGASSAIPQ